MIGGGNSLAHVREFARGHDKLCELASENHFAFMKTNWVIGAAILMGSASFLFAAVPIVAARDHLGKAQSILANLESGGKRKRRASIQAAIGELNRAESKLNEAKAELEGTKGNKEEKSKHLQKAAEAMEEAMKRVKLAVAVKK
jgi:hypothetical protein